MRIEKKYELIQQDVSLETLHHHLSALGFRFRKYSVGNLYFDTFDRKSFYQKVSGADYKEKFRLRQYDQTSPFFFEVKKKEGDVSIKSKTLVSDPRAFQNKLEQQVHLEPVCWVNYQRSAWEHPQLLIKINFDSDLQIRSVMTGKEVSVKMSVFELKFLLGNDSWQFYDKLLLILGLKRCSLSKYELGYSHVL